MDESATYELTVGQVAALVAADASSVRRWADRGLLPCWRTPTGHRKFRRRDVDELIARGHH